MSPRDYGPDLLLAARNGHKNTAKTLITEYKVSPNLRNKYGQTPLSIAAKFGDVEFVKLLLRQRNIKVNLKDNLYRTPLAFAAYGGHTKVVELLLNRDDIKADSKDNFGRTPLSLAVERGHMRVVTLLVGRDDVDIDSKDERGRTPLLYARHKDIVNLLHQPKEKLCTITNDEYNRLCLNPFNAWEFRKGYSFPRHARIPGLAQTDPVPLYHITPTLKAEECRAEAAKYTSRAIRQFYTRFSEDYLTLAYSAAHFARYAQLHQFLISKTYNKPMLSSATEQDPQNNSLLLSRLPREIRDKIWRQTFKSVEEACITEQLRGSSEDKLKHVMMDFRPLRTCRQVYREARTIAMVFLFAECPQRLSALQQIHTGPYQIAVWANPYSPLSIKCDFKELFKLEIRTLTICSNWILFEPDNDGAMDWIRMLLSLAERIVKLKELRVLIGCKLTAQGQGKSDNGNFAQELRRGWNSFIDSDSKTIPKVDSEVIPNISVESFAGAATTTSISFRKNVSGIKVVTLEIASVYEAEDR